MENLKVSVIIPVFNAEMYISRCINSIINQTYRNIEVILVNDGSTDRSLQICEDFAEKYYYIKVISKKNGGPASARNVGINAAGNDYIIFIDADDYISEDLFYNLVHNVNNDIFVKANYKCVSERNGKIKAQKNNLRNYTIQEYNEKILLGEIHGGICGALFSRSKLSDLKFDELTYFMEDTMFLFEYLASMQKVIIEGTYFYTINNNSITISNEKILDNIKNMNYSLNEIYKKNHFLNEKNLKFLISLKKIIIIEAELAKVQRLEELSDILNNNSFEELLKKLINYNQFPFYYKKYYLLLINKEIKKLYFYIKLRKWIKIIKNRLLRR